MVGLKAELLIDPADELSMCGKAPIDSSAGATWRAGASKSDAMPSAGESAFGAHAADIAQRLLATP